MGIVKISDELHEEVRKASGAMARSINSQVEYWLKIGMLAELNPNHNYQQLLQMLMQQADVKLAGYPELAPATGAANERRSA